MKSKIYLIIVTTLLISCTKEIEEPKPLSNSQTVIVRNLPANPEIGGTGHFTFFSLKNNQIVPHTDSNSTKWDLGFNATKIITNSGSSGPGQVGLQIYTGLFESLIYAAETGYQYDTNDNYALPTGTGNGWYNYNSTTHVIHPIPGRVLIIKTNENRYAKIEILSYYQDAPAIPVNTDISRYYTFKYTYQSDGTRKF